MKIIEVWNRMDKLEAKIGRIEKIMYYLAGLFTLQVGASIL